MFEIGDWQLKNCALTMELEKLLWKLKVEAELSTLAFSTHDANEGMSAFLGKRKAKFEDR